jgi:hypothetical protein
MESKSEKSFIEIEDASILKSKILNQKSVIKEYKDWLQMLLKILNTTSGFEYHTQIKKGVDKIETICKDNLYLKRSLWRERLNEESLMEKLDKSEKNISFLLQDNEKEVKKVLIKEKLHLVNSIESISEDLDKATELNDQYKELDNIINKKEIIMTLQHKIKQLSRENKDIKNKILKGNDTFVKSNKDQSLFNVFSCMNATNDKESTIFLKK